MAQAQPQRELKSTSYELFILLLSILSIFDLIYMLLPWTDPVVRQVVEIMDGFVTVIFMGDFLYRLFTASSKSGYFFRTWGWADLLASMPFAQLKIFRIFRIVRVVRLMRSFGLDAMRKEIRDNRSGSAAYLVLFLVLLVLQFGGMGIVRVEAANPEANIKTGADGVWWTFVTITTVGYGDRFPVTPAGRLVAMATMVLGVGVFGVFTGLLATRFISGPPEEEQAEKDALNASLDKIHKALSDQAAANAALQERLDHMEERLRRG